MHPYVDLDRAQAALIVIRKAPEELITELCKNEDFKKQYHLLKEMLRKKIDNNEAFLAFDLAEELRKCYRMITEHAIVEEKIKTAQAEELLKELASYTQKMQKRYELEAGIPVDVIPDEKVEVFKLHELLEKITEILNKLQAIEIKSNSLQEMQRLYEETVDKAVESVAKKFEESEHFAEYNQDFIKFADKLDDAQRKKIDDLKQEQKDVLAAQLKMQPFANDLLRIPQLRAAADELTKGQSSEEEKRKAIIEVTKPAQRCLVDINVIGGYVNYLRGFRAICLKNLKLEDADRERLEKWNIVGFVRSGVKNEKAFKEFMDANENFLDDLQKSHFEHASKMENSTADQAKLVTQLEGFLGQLRKIEQESTAEYKPSTNRPGCK
jgi:hypothetical protein